MRTSESKTKLVLSLSFWMIVFAPLLADSSTTAKGVMILTSASGSDPRNVLFSDQIWTDFYGGNVIDSDGQKSAFAKKDIGKIIYFDSAYYTQLNNDPQEKAFREGIQAREVVTNTSFLNLNATNDLKSLEDSEAYLESLAHNYLAIQSLIQPQIDRLKDDVTKLSGGQCFVDGKWMSQQQAALQTATPVVGQSRKPVTFTTKDGKRFVNATVTVADKGVSVLTSDGGASVSFDQLPDDISGFPSSVQKLISEKRQASLIQKSGNSSEPPVLTSEVRTLISGDAPTTKQIVDKINVLITVNKRLYPTVDEVTILEGPNKDGEFILKYDEGRFKEVYFHVADLKVKMDRAVDPRFGAFYYVCLVDPYTYNENSNPIVPNGAFHVIFRDGSMPVNASVVEISSTAGDDYSAVQMQTLLSSLISASASIESTPPTSFQIGVASEPETSLGASQYMQKATNSSYEYAAQIGPLAGDAAHKDELVKEKLITDARIIWDVVRLAKSGNKAATAVLETTCGSENVRILLGSNEQVTSEAINDLALSGKGDAIAKLLGSTSSGESNH